MLTVSLTCDTLLLSRNLGRSFFVLEPLAPLSLSEISRGLFSLVFAGGHYLKCCIQSIARVLKSFHNNRVSHGDESKLSKVNAIDNVFKCVTDNISFIRPFSVLSQGIALDLSKLQLKTS